jgi:hypothetical protein
MNTANHLSQEDLALFALQFMPEDELKSAIDHMEHCEACRQDVAQIQGDLVTYAMSAEQHTPPAMARERLLRRVAKEKKPVPIDRDQTHFEPVLASRNSLLFPLDATEQRSPSRGMGFLAAAGWIIAAGISVVAGMQFHQRQVLQASLNQESAKVALTAADSARALDTMHTLQDGGALQVALQLKPLTGPPPAAKPQGIATYDADKGALVFIASHLDPLQQYKTYELWVLPTTGHGDPIPAGTFKPDASGNANVIMPDLPKGVPASGFGVTIEDDGGSKTPTQPIVLYGTI